MSIVAQTRALDAVQELLGHDAAEFIRLGVRRPTNLLLSGPPGVGKTKAVVIAAANRKIPIFSVIPGPNIRDEIEQAFKSARNAKCGDTSEAIVFIDEIDAVCPASASQTASSISSAIASLVVSYIDPPPLQCLKRPPKSLTHVFVIAATNIPNGIHASLLRPGRFDRHVLLTAPAFRDRLNILRALQPTADLAALTQVAERAAGYVVADLCALSTAAEKFQTQELQPSSPSLVPPTLENLMKALRVTKPSVLRTNLAPDIPATKWDDIAGVTEVKKRLQMAVEWPLRHARTFKRLGLKRPRGILLHGPPGCSKTSLVRAAASAAHTPFLRLTAADIYSSFLGDSERSIRDAFATARASAPCILFFDEIDALVGKRDVSSNESSNGVQQRVLSTLLTEMDGVIAANGVLVVAATNRIDMLDDALLRPGRFDDILVVGLPDFETRLAILELYCKTLVLSLDVDLPQLAQELHDWSGADLKSMCSEAALAAIREYYAGPSSEMLDKESKDSSAEEPDIVVSMRHFRV